jgi:hypothetical protein
LRLEIDDFPHGRHDDGRDAVCGATDAISPNRIDMGAATAVEPQWRATDGRAGGGSTHAEACQNDIYLVAYGRGHVIPKR